MSENVINAIHTPCKKCVFAKYDNITQVGCYLDLIDKYRSKDVEILEAYDKQKEFYIINKKKCYGYKEDKYFELRDLGESSLEEKIDYIKKTFIINYVAVINIKQYSLEQLDEIIGLLVSCEVPPKKIVLIRYEADARRYDFDSIKKLLDKHNPKEWRVQSILDNDSDYLNVLHQTTNISKNNFILSINGDYDRICNIISFAQNMIYNDFGTFVVLSDQSKSTIFFNKAVYKSSFANGKDILSDHSEYILL